VFIRDRGWWWDVGVVSFASRSVNDDCKETSNIAKVNEVGKRLDFHGLPRGLKRSLLWQ